MFKITYYSSTNQAKTNIYTINIILRLRCSVGSSIYFFMTTKKVIFYFLKYYHAANPFIRKLCQLSDQRRGIFFFVIIIHHCLSTTVAYKNLESVLKYKLGNVNEANTWNIELHFLKSSTEGYMSK